MNMTEAYHLGSVHHFLNTQGGMECKNPFPPSNKLHFAYNKGYLDASRGVYNIQNEILFK